MIDSSNGTGTCSGTYLDARSAFGLVPPATGATVSYLLSYAASQSNVGGYHVVLEREVHATTGQECFDAINNQVAFAP